MDIKGQETAWLSVWGKTDEGGGGILTLMADKHLCQQIPLSSIV